MNRKTKAMLEIAQKSGDWESCLASFSEQHQSILRAIGSKTTTAASVARRLLLPQRSISSATTKLCRDGVLERASIAQYTVADRSFADYLDSAMIPQKSKHDIAKEAEKIAYRGMAPFFEALEEQQLIVGKGDDIAQACASLVMATVLNRWREKPKK